MGRKSRLEMVEVGGSKVRQGVNNGVGQRTYHVKGNRRTSEVGSCQWGATGRAVGGEELISRSDHPANWSWHLAENPKAPNPLFFLSSFNSLKPAGSLQRLRGNMQPPQNYGDCEHRCL